LRVTREGNSYSEYGKYRSSSMFQDSRIVHNAS